MKNLASAVGILAVMISAAMVCGDDLRLKNGKVYKNYRIKSIQNGVAEVLFLSDDNKPDSVRVSQTVLPDEVLKKYSALIKDQSLGRQMAGWVKVLEKSLSALDEKERAKRSLLLAGFRKQLAEAIAKEADMADFTVVANDKNGAVAQVVGSYPDSKFKSGQYVFIAGKYPEVKSFKLKVYPVGFSGQYGKYGTLWIYAASQEKANKTALQLVAASLGDMDLFEADSDDDDDSKENFSRNEAAGQIVNNYFYYDDDNDLDGWYWVVPRRPHGPKPHGPRPHGPRPHRPKPHGPKPHGPKPLPPLPPRPGVGSNYEQLKGPTVVKNNGHSGNYGLLPKHLIPGSTGPAKR